MIRNNFLLSASFFILACPARAMTSYEASKARDLHEAKAELPILVQEACNLDLDAFKKLLAEGADPNLIFTFYNKKQSLLPFLYDQDLPKIFFHELLKQPKINVNQMTEDQETILHLAVFNHDKETIELLLEFGDIDINKFDNRGQTPLHQIFKRQRRDKEFCANMQEIIQLLLAHGADPGLKSKDAGAYDGYACSEKNRPELKKILKEGRTLYS